MTIRPTSSAMSRRQLLIGLGSAAALAACSSVPEVLDETTGDSDPVDTPETEGSDSASADSAGTASEPATPIDVGRDLTAADFAIAGTCALLRETTAGPFPLDEHFDRRDVSEGYPGHPLRLGIRVLDQSCAPLQGAAVEVWMTDASGDYSALIDDGDGKDEGPGTTFQRGTQVSNAEGIVEFLSIYPGHYPGRPPHIHIRVAKDGNVLRTGQLFFDDDYSVGIYSTGEYEQFGTDFTRTDDDGIARNALEGGGMLYLAEAETTRGSGSIGLTNLSFEV